MGTIRVDLIQLVKTLQKMNVPKKQIRKVMFDFERRIAAWGKQFPGASLHERTRMTVQTSAYDGTTLSAITSDHAILRYADSYLELSKIPDEAVERFYRDVFPELHGDVPALPGKEE